MLKKFTCYILSVMMIVGSLSVGFAFAEDGGDGIIPTDQNQVEESDLGDEDVTNAEDVSNEDEEAPAEEDPASDEDSGTIEAQDVVATPTNLTATATNTNVALTWDEVTGAKSYKIQVYKDGTLVKTETSTTTSYTVKSLDEQTTYVFTVKAVIGTEESAESASATATTGDVVLGKSQFYAYLDGTNVKLKWTAASEATGYQIQRYNKNTKKWVTETTINSGKAGTKTVSIKHAGFSYGTSTYRIRPTHGSKVGAWTKADLVHSILYTGHTRSKTKLFATKKSKKVVGTIKGGTKVTVLVRQNKRFLIQLSNGKTYWVNPRKVKRTKTLYTTKDYSTAVKESYINTKNFKSKTNNLIWVNHYTQKANFFKKVNGKWKLYKTVKVGTGRMSAATPRGTFKIGKKESGWFYSHHKNLYISHFSGRNSFHTRPQTKTSTKMGWGRILNKKLGKPVSKGCVRMSNSNAQYVYKYMKKGTTVVSQ